jgi:hypothetical protein
MEKGLKDLKERNEEAYYKYIAQNNLDNPEQRLKYETKEKIKNVFKKIFSFISLIIIVGIIIPFAYNKFSSLTTKTNNIELGSPISNIDNNIITPKQNKQKEIVECLNTLRPYMDNISNDIKKKNSDIEQINNKRLTQNEYIKSIQAHDELVKKNIKDISNITVPSELNNYITQMNEGYQLLCEGYEDESIYLKTNQQKYKQLADNNYKLSNEKLNGSNAELTKVLDSNNIMHK